MNTEIAVIGAGAAGTLAAIGAAEQGAKVVLLDKNAKIGRKIAITGKGRCNVTNACDKRTFLENVVSNPRFLYSSAAAFGPEDTMRLLKNADVPLKIERGNRVFPESDRSFDVIDGLLRSIRKSGAMLELERNVTAVIKTEDGFMLKTDHESIRAKSVILATGGLSYPGTGSTGDGYRFAKELGLPVTSLRPSLIPFTSSTAWCRELMGLSLKNVAIKVCASERSELPAKVKKKPIYSDFGEMLFTHFGVSGPLILSASAVVQLFLEKHKISYQQAALELHIDLKSALDDKTLDQRLLRDLQKHHAKDIRNALEELLPKRLIPIVVKEAGIKGNTVAGELTKEQREGLCHTLKDLKIAITGTGPMSEAIITQGGVGVKDIDPATMMAKTVPGLFVAGELLDVDAFTGGFNLQIAFTTGKAAGKGAAGYVKNLN